MKKILVLLLSLLCATSAIADQRSDEVLSKLREKIASLGDYKVSITIDAKGIYKGEIIVSGERYYMDFIDAMGFEVICDGKTRYEINDQDKEVTISKVKPNDKSFASSPAAMFLFADEEYTHSHIGTRNVNGVLCDVIAMESSRTYIVFAKITIAVAVQSELPVQITYLRQTSTDGETINFHKFESVGRAPESLFKFDSKNYKDYEIIDFR